MSSLPALTAITNGTPADATEVDGNFDTLATFVDNELVNRDGTVAMTAELTLSSSAPAAALSAASKGYADSVAPTTAEFTRTTDISVASGGSGTVTFEAESNDTAGWWTSGTTFTVPATGLYLLTAWVKKASGAGSPTFTLDMGGDVADLFIGSVDTAATASNSGGGAVYLEAGTTFALDYTENFGAVCTIDTVKLFITDLRL